ncbi:hypothetical protein BOTBODRAFT_510653 [Botryobasidium botryosum FD-172 SS1]|uniref:F-box domain-containing protein n=1 Tax=Botryobasidium botryosum (strain FD-172 SS1) TaxID=930990 RepID=A0A067MRL1_BOTB1|nr:hypothetical protein BOTBODRAFT_510653 [Botryobasidium botryosum FD-172 SS1]
MHRLRKLELSDVPEMTLSTTLFPHTHAPLLRHPHLTHASIPSTSSLYTCLSTLTIRSIRFNSSPTWLLSKLQACPLLEQLTVCDVYFTLPADLPHPPFPLPKLQSVDLECGTGPLIALSLTR